MNVLIDYLIKSNSGLVLMLLMATCTACNSQEKTERVVDTPIVQIEKEIETLVDTAEYNSRLLQLANGDTTGRWPVKLQPYPLKGAILPFKRVVAYYGNIYSKRMGVLGKYPPKEMWRRLNLEIDAWEQADSLTPVQPAIHYIAVVAQNHPSSGGMYRLRMPDHQIDSVLSIAKMGNAILFLDIQPGHSNVAIEVPRLEKYLKMAHVHLAIDPEFSMKEGSVPGTKKGYVGAEEINFCTEYLAQLVRKHNLPPKIMVVHRFTQRMVRNYKEIKLHPEVQIVMHMDGWGGRYLKRSTYRDFIYPEPVQFTGFKLFYINDLRPPSTRLLTPQEILKLTPKPIYIQYQ